MTTLPAGEDLALAEGEVPRLQRGGFFLRVLRERKSAVVGLGIIIFFIVLSLVAPYISPYSATQQTCRVYAPPSSRHWLGCDDGGIDMVSLLMQGGRISLVVGFAATFVAMVIGGGVGLLSGYFGRWVDASLMRVTDYLLVIPDLVFMTVIAAVWGASLLHVILVIGILEWTSTARIIRAQVTLPDTVRIGSPQELVRRRPDVLSAERQVAAQGLFVSAAQAEYLPKITLAASAGYAATSFDSLSRRGTSRIVAGPVITFPLLDMGRVKARVDVAHARENEAKAQYNATVLRAVEETETALVAYDRAHARLALLGEAVRASTRAWELAQQRFDAGLTDFLQVLDAQRTLLDAENQLALAHTAAATSLVAVYKATGGTWPIK